jgi:hypothetical protein
LPCPSHGAAPCLLGGPAGHDPHTGHTDHSHRVAHHALEWNAVANLIAHRLRVALIPRLAHLAPHLPIMRIPLHGNPRPVRKLLTCTRTGGHRHPAIAAALQELHRIGPATVSHPPARR